MPNTRTAAAIALAFVLGTVVSPIAAAPTVHTLAPGESITIIAATAPPSLAPTSPPSVAPSPTVAPTLAPTPTAAPTVAPTIAPTPAPTPPAAGALLGLDFAGLARTGPAWDRVRALSDTTAQLDQGNIDAPGVPVLLAKAARYAATGETKYRDQTIAMLQADLPMQLTDHEPALALGRNLAARAIAASWIGYDDAGYKARLAALRTTKTGSGDTATLTTTHEKRGNNFSTAAGMSRIAIDLYIGDATDLARAVTVHRGYVGERSAYTGFVFGSLSWQSSPTTPVGINPIGATISGRDVDGVLPDDQRRGGSFTWPPPCENYVWQALGELLVTSALLDSPRYGGDAITRAYAWLDRFACTAVGDDRWQPRMAASLLGARSRTPSGYQDGKSFGLTDWLYP